VNHQQMIAAFVVAIGHPQGGRLVPDGEAPKHIGVAGRESGATMATSVARRRVANRADEASPRDLAQPNQCGIPEEGK